MLIRSQITRNPDGPLAGFVWAGETDPGWIRFRTDPRSGVMSGLHLTPCDGTVPRGTPFKFRFPNRDQAMRGSEGVAMLILGQLSRDPVHLEGEAGNTSDPHAQLAAWQEFLGSGPAAPGLTSRDRQLIMPRETYQASLAGSALFRRMRGGDLVLGRSAQFRLGAPMSGFDAIAAARRRFHGEAEAAVTAEQPAAGSLAEEMLEDADEMTKPQ
jgi:hypothetical protein